MAFQLKPNKKRIGKQNDSFSNSFNSQNRSSDSKSGCHLLQLCHPSLRIRAARPAKTRSLQCRARETGWGVKYKKAQFLMKLRLISKMYL